MKKLLFVAAACVLAVAHAAELAPGDFRWRATVDTTPHTGLVRLALPADALQRLQSRTAADLRLFDAAGQPVPFAFATPPLPKEGQRASSAPVRALPLHAAQSGQRPPKGAVQVRVEQGAQAQSVWVQLGSGEAPTTGPRLPAALFDTRALKEPLAALQVQGRLPPNVPVQVTASTSSDLANWQPVPVQGRLFRFEGDGAPANQTLELREPLQLEGRYLRLDWSGHDGVAIEAIAGLVAARQVPPSRPAATLPAPRAEEPAVREWQLDFGTPIAQLELGTTRANTLLPLRILGRNQVSEPWRLLAQTVVYRLGPPGQESTNTPVVLNASAVRWLRIEATHGMRLDAVPLTARVLFDPMEVVFVAGGAGPYQLAAGRKDATPAVALPLGMLAATTATQVDALPLARITAMRGDPVAPAPAWARWLPAGIDLRTAGLWTVLLLGVLVLGGVAWSLLRHVNRDTPPAA